MHVKQRLLEGFAFIFGGRLGSGILTVLITPIIVRVLGSGGYGDYAFALAVYSTLRTVSGGGIYEGARKYIAETDDREERSAVVRYYLNIAIIFGGTVAFGLAGVTFLVVGTVILEPRLRTYLYMVALLVLLHPFFYVVRSTLMGHELERFSEPLIVVDKIILAVVGVSLAYGGLHVTGLLAGHIIALVTIIVIGSVAISRHTDVVFRRSRLLVSELSDIWESRMFRYSMLTILFVSLTKSLYTVDIILLQPFAGSQEVGYYRAALVTAEFLWFVPYALQIVLLHSTSRLWAEDRVAEIDAIASRMTRYTLTLTGLMAVLLVTVGDSFIPIYFGSEFSISYLPMMLLLPGVICFAVARPIYAIGQGHGNIRLLVLSTGVAAGINVLLNLLLIPQYGMYGAAVATSIGYGSMIVLHTRAAHVLGFYPLRDIRPVRILVPVLVCLPVLWYLDGFVTSGRLSVLVVVPVGITVFGMVALLTGAIRWAEISELRPPQ